MDKPRRIRKRGKCRKVQVSIVGNIEGETKIGWLHWHRHSHVYDVSFIDLEDETGRFFSNMIVTEIIFLPDEGDRE